MALVLDIFDDENTKKVLLYADYAIIYESTLDLIDLQGNVVITTHDGQLY